MNESINLAIILDFENFTKSNISQKEMETQLSTFLLFLQIWRKNHENRKRKIFISYTVSTQFKSQFYRQQYFTEFDKTDWCKIRDFIAKEHDSPSLTDQPISPESLEEHFLKQLKRFASDFYWDNSHVYSPSNNNSRFDNAPAPQNYIRRNIALYVTASIYPIVIESKNTLKVIVNSLEANSVAFIWLSGISQNLFDLSTVINTISLFNGCFIPFQFPLGSIHSFGRYHSFINSCTMISRSQIHQRRNEMLNIHKSPFNLPIQLKFRINDDIFVIDAISLTPLPTTKLEFVPTHESSGDAKYHTYFILKDYPLKKFPSDIVFYKCCQFDTDYQIQRLLSCNVCVLHSVRSDPISFQTADCVSNCISNIFEPWHFFRPSKENICQLLSINDIHLPPVEEIPIFFNSCLSAQNSVCYLDSINPSKLKLLMGFQEYQKPCLFSEDYNIKYEYKKWQNLYNHFSILFELETEKWEIFSKNYCKPVNFDLLNSELEIVDFCKSQVMFRVFAINVFRDLVDYSLFISEMILLLRKLSLLQMPKWVGQFLKNDMIDHHQKGEIINQLREIYDELCYPFPKSLESPSQIHSFSTENIAKDVKAQTLNQLKRQNSTVSVAERNKSKGVTKRKHLAVASTKNRITSLNSVKRCLFGNRPIDVHSNTSRPDLYKSNSSMIFHISSESNTQSPDKSQTHSESIRFYMSNSISNPINFHKEASDPVNSNETLFTTFRSPILSSFEKSPCLIKDSTPSPCSTHLSHKITPDRKYTMDPSSWDATPFKYYRLTHSITSTCQTSSPIQKVGPIFNKNPMFNTPPEKSRPDKSVKTSPSVVAK